MALKLLFLVAYLCTVYFVQGTIYLQRHGIPPPPPMARDAKAASWGTITQKLDNFDSNNQKTWNMRYIVNDQWFKAGGPIFIMIGAEWTIEPGWVQGGQMYDIAKQVGAMMYYTEHRYYGQSRPTSDLSTANLRYLSTDQALADLAHFITTMKNSDDQLANAKVAVFGGSYGGTMAIWMRQKYPNLVQAAHSSSGPLKAKADFFEYMDVVQRSLADASCLNIIRNGMSQLQDLINSPNGPAKVSNDFNLCNDLNPNNFYDVAYFNNVIGSMFAGLVQYSTPASLKNTCDTLKSQSGDDYSKLVSFYRLQHSSGCSGDYDNFVRYFAQINLAGDSRQWIYQTCTEYGWFQTSSGVFGNTFPVALNYQWCRDIYGEQFTQASIDAGINDTNRKHGALNPNVTNVVSVHGTLDPWSAVGLTASSSTSAPVIIVKDYSHCADMQSLSSSNSAEMQNAKRAVQNYIKEWIK